MKKQLTLLFILLANPCFAQNQEETTLYWLFSGITLFLFLIILWSIKSNKSKNIVKQRSNQTKIVAKNNTNKNKIRSIPDHVIGYSSDSSFENFDVNIDHLPENNSNFEQQNDSFSNASDYQSPDSNNYNSSSDSISYDSGSSDGSSSSD